MLISSTTVTWKEKTEATMRNIIKKMKKQIKNNNSNTLHLNNKKRKIIPPPWVMLSMPVSLHAHYPELVVSSSKCARHLHKKNNFKRFTLDCNQWCWLVLTKTLGSVKPLLTCSKSTMEKKQNVSHLFTVNNKANRTALLMPLMLTLNKFHTFSQISHMFCCYTFCGTKCEQLSIFRPLHLV